MSLINKAAWLDEANTPLQVRDAPMPVAGPNELVIRNAAVAINPVDTHMQKVGVFVQQWPTILGCDVSGEVQEVGPEAQGRFKKGDRVIGHTVTLLSGKPQDGAYALYCVVPADKAAILPNNIAFTDAVVIPFALEAAVCALSLKTPGIALPGVATPALGLPYPSLQPSRSGKVIVVNGGSSSVGSMTTQVATAAGLTVIAITSASNFQLSKECGAVETFDYHDPSHADQVVEAVKETGLEFVGIFDAISIPETYKNDLKILEKLGGGHLACSHPPPEEVPDNVTAGMIFAVNDIATPVWRDFVTTALKSGQIKCLPKATIVGKGLEYVQEALNKCQAGVSASKVVVEL